MSTKKSAKQAPEKNAIDFNKRLKSKGRKFVVVNTPPSYWNPDRINEQIEGLLTRSNERKGKFGLQKTFYIETDDGEIGLPSHAVLNNGMSRINIGDFVRITYLGEDEEKGFQNYLVEKAV